MNRAEIDVAKVFQLQEQWTAEWHNDLNPTQAIMPWIAVELNHRMNFELWHEEDVARRDDLGPSRICEAKRTIDKCNQVRNNSIEEFDHWLLGQMPPGQTGLPLHSETPGMIMDRLSILSLKAYHMNIEAARESASASHRNQCLEKLRILQEQRSDLAHCFKVLLEDLSSGKRRFKVYRQFKMYNDPSLNPQLYATESSDGTGDAIARVG